MLLQEIVGQLDAELERLVAIRAIVNTLGRTPQLLQRFEQEILPAPETAVEEPAKPALVSRRSSARAKGLRTYRRRREHPAEPSAFAKRIPAGPVVVSAQQLQDHKQRKDPNVQVETVPSASAPAGEQPDRLIRDLSQRWLSSR